MPSEVDPRTQKFDFCQKHLNCIAKLMKDTDVPNQTVHMLIQCAWGRVFAMLRVAAF